MHENFTAILAHAAIAAVSPTNLLFCFLGTIIGIIIGALPGFTSTMGVALFIPFSYSMEPATGMIFLVAIYCASTYGGSISAILINTPGTPSAVITTIDGYEMTKNGEGGRALAMAAFASLIGGIVSAFALLLIAPPLARLVLLFGPTEVFYLALFGLSIIVGFSKGSMIKGLISGVAGLLLATVGVDAISGVYRYTFDNISLFEGVPIVPMVIGLFSACQVFSLGEQKRTTIQRDIADFHDSCMPRLQDIKENWVNMLRSSVIGTIVGIIPAAGMSIACAISYNEAKRASKFPEKFGNGSVEGVIASEAANNGVTGGSLVPLLTLGIPGNTVSAIFLGGIMIHGLRPGLQLFTKYANISYTLLLGLFVANVMMFVVGVLAARRVARVTRISTDVLAPVIMVLCVVGSYAIRNNLFDIGVMIAAGILGFLMKRWGYSTPSLILGLILGPMAEGEFRRAVMLSKGDWSYFYRTPLSIFLLLLVIVTLIAPVIKRKNGTATKRETR
ncbi:MAG: tripartite tricarboxylate transporter permease [Clostridia bacterium]|nr:tripartite tricarboxylate transporter permease [Clostridia bacterium]